MQPIKDLYQAYKSINNIENVAYEKLLLNYLQYNIKGPKKLIDIESTDQESILNSISPGIPYQGMVYTFIHLNKDGLSELENLKTGKTVTFHDFTPILFCTSYDPINKLIKGINLNLLPKSERLKFLQSYYETYQEFFERVEELTEYNKIAINQEYRIIAMAGKNRELFTYFNKKNGSMFNFAYRSYSMLNLRNFRMIEYVEWPYILFFNSRDTIKQANLEIIYRMYFDSKNS
jgi:hypothetical protein